VTAAAPLTYPLAGLLAELPGTTRTYEIHGVTIPLPDDLRLSDPIEGTVDVTRTNRGVLIRGTLHTAIMESCARCLREVEVPIEVLLDEEALPSVDLATGAPVDPSAEPDVTRLTAHHELALGPLVTEAISLAEPIATLCEPDCPGLCPTCGERLGPEHVAHADDALDPRLEVLRGFRVDDDGESE